MFISTGFEGKRVYFEVKNEEGGFLKCNDLFIRTFFSTKYATGGSGLGLYLSKSIIEEFGGEIIIESEENRGTKIKVYLPCES